MTQPLPFWFFHTRVTDSGLKRVQQKAIDSKKIANSPPPIVLYHYFCFSEAFRDRLHQDILKTVLNEKSTRRSRILDTILYFPIFFLFSSSLTSVVLISWECHNFVRLPAGRNPMWVLASTTPIRYPGSMIQHIFNDQEWLLSRNLKALIKIIRIGSEIS